MSAHDSCESCRLLPQFSGQPYVELERLRAEIKRYTYKPGYQLHFDMDFVSGRIMFNMQADLPDSRRPERLVPIRLTRLVPPALGRLPRREFREWLKKEILYFEHHEVDEWLRCDGQLVNDPHARSEL